VRSRGKQCRSRGHRGGVAVRDHARSEAMKAIVCEKQGPPEVMKLADVPDPVAGPGEAVVRLHAAGLNHRDVWIRQGLYARIQLPCVLGSDGAGVVETGALAGKRAVLFPCEKWGP